MERAKARLRGRPWRDLAADYLLITLGVWITALGNALFLIPNRVISGGVTGLAVVLHYVIGTPVGLTVLILNLPLFYLGWRRLGGLAFGVRTVYATVVLSLAFDLLTGRLPAPTRDPLLYILYGGLLDGLGIGLVFRARGTTGGTDILGRVLAQVSPLTPGQAMALFNGAVIVAAGLAFGPEQALYALVVAFVSGRAVDVVLQGLRYSSVALIVTDRPQAVRQAILEGLNRGATVLRAEGAYTGSARTVILSAVTRPEIAHLTRLIRATDPEAFVILAPAQQVIGRGFLPIDRVLE